MTRLLLVVAFWAVQVVAIAQSNIAIEFENGVGMKWEGFKFHLKVRSVGEVAVVSSMLDFKVTTGIGIPMSSAVLVTDVWVRGDGQ